MVRVGSSGNMVNNKYSINDLKKMVDKIDKLMIGKQYLVVNITPDGPKFSAED